MSVYIFDPLYKTVIEINNGDKTALRTVPQLFQYKEHTTKEMFLVINKTKLYIHRKRLERTNNCFLVKVNYSANYYQQI